MPSEKDVIRPAITAMGTLMTVARSVASCPANLSSTLLSTVAAQVLKVLIQINSQLSRAQEKNEQSTHVLMFLYVAIHRWRISDI